MVVYNFGAIKTVPTGEEFINFTLCKTNRKTPTIIHKHYLISRIRKFYMKKVKFTQQNFHDRLTSIITEFPKIEELHPFYADLLNTLYNKDHYKLSLGQLTIARQLIDKIASDYVKLLKFGDSLYRCKQLKRAALGRMVTLVKKQSPALTYLEEVRQHLSRLPSIQPNDRTLILCGCPNAGKSSFMNLVTNADVEVQPYAFTTKALYVGVTDYEYLRWQVIDTPGLLDRPFDEMNTIELQAITALAHIHAAVIFFLDISEQCFVSIEEQMKIYESMKPLFSNKPILIACNKSDVISLEELAAQKPDSYKFIDDAKKDGVPILEMSTYSKDGVMDVKALACKMLLELRIANKLQSKKTDSILNRLHVGQPKPRDDKIRAAFIPEGACRCRVRDYEDETPMLMEKHIRQEMKFLYTTDLNKNKDLENPEWHYDKIPQIIDGHNIADFIDPELQMKLDALEKEEEEREKSGFYEFNVTETLEQRKIRLLAEEIIKRKKIYMATSALDKGTKSIIPRASRKRERSVSRLRDGLSSLGVDMSDSQNSHFANQGESRSRPPLKKARADSEGRVRSSSKPPRDLSGVRDVAEIPKIKRLNMKAQKKRQQKGHTTESDRKIIENKPMHLYAGKRGIGKTERR